jgi:holin-like protein
MLKAFSILIAAQLIGTGLQISCHLPLPGSVIGLFLLALLLATRPVWQTPGLDRVAGGLLRHMGLLFVPAGVGLIDHLDLVRAQTLPLVVGLVGSTLLTLVATALIMEWHGKISIRMPGGFHVRRRVAR